MTGTPVPPDRSAPDRSVLARPLTSFAELADYLYAEPDYAAVYRSICDAAPLLVTGCDHASLMLREGHRFVTVGASSPVAGRIDAMEREVGEGPCLDAIVDESAQLDSDLTDGSAWPTLGARILTETPVRGAAGFRLMNSDGKAGALNLFSETPGALTPAAADQGAVLAAFTSVALLAVANKQAADTLRSGLDSNREIGKAVGLLMAFHKVDDEQAFAMLRTASQDMNIKLAKIAGEVVAHHNRR